MDVRTNLNQKRGAETTTHMDYNRPRVPPNPNIGRDESNMTENYFINRTMTVASRVVITVCLLLSACASSYAQKPDQDPLQRVIAELQAGRTEEAFAALDELIKRFPKLAD